MSCVLPAITPSTAAAGFTLDGSDELEDRLADACEEIRARVQGLLPPGKLEGLLLGGGYGRGEGGVLKTDAGDQPYNDLEFYVFIRGNNWLNERRFGLPLYRLAHELALTAGAEVEFKVISRAKLRRSAASMFYYDLVMGHCRLLGDEALLAGCAHHRQAQNLPLSEATRLMMNRCSGLLLARERIERAPFTPEDADFAGRNLAKAQLALGDAVLTVFGRYHWSCRERHERLQGLLATQEFPRPAEVCEHHAAGMEFKLHPVRARLGSRDLRLQHHEISGLALEIWLWLESHRLGRRFHSAREYAASSANKFPCLNRGATVWSTQKPSGPRPFSRSAAAAIHAKES